MGWHLWVDFGLKSTVYWAYLGRSWPLDPPIGRVLANPRPYGAGAYPCKSAEAPYRRGGAAGVGSEYNIKRSEWSGDSLTFRVTTRPWLAVVCSRILFIAYPAKYQTFGSTLTPTTAPTPAACGADRACLCRAGTYTQQSTNSELLSHRTLFRTLLAPS